jgi:hypothetical protein
MNTRKKIILLFIISLVALLLGVFLTNSVRFGFCLHEQYACRDILNNIGDPLFYGMSALSLVFLILALIPQAFSAWKKFAKWFIPIATLIFIFYPQPGSGDLFSPYPEQVFKWASIFYIVISVIIIASNRKS